MARSGVRPLADRQGKEKGRGKGGDRREAEAQAARPATPPGPAKGAITARPPAPPLPTARPPVRANEPAAELWSELDRLRALSEARQKELVTARAGLAAEAEARAALEAELREARQEAAGLVAERAELEGRLATLSQERDEVMAHRRTLQRALAELQGLAPPPPRSVRDAFEARGLVGDTESDLLLRALGEAREGGAFISMLQAADADTLAAFLDDRVALLCGNPQCPVPPGRAVLTVPPARCDVCGGSDVRRAVRRFQDAALLAGLSRIVIVGGSPQYHRQLRTLLTDPRIKLSLVPGDHRRTSRQVRADEAGADLVILWGATLLDHSLSGLYGRGEGRVLRIPHRGIARMLEKAADEIE